MTGNWPRYIEPTEPVVSGKSPARHVRTGTGPHAQALQSRRREPGLLEPAPQQE